MGAITVLGVLHHSPNCARSLRGALADLRPDIVLVEGPPDAQPLLPQLLHGEMEPPVALLVYAARRPSAAAVFPFAVFSPEWQALRYALATDGCAARFMDLPMAVQLASLQQEQEGAAPGGGGAGAGGSEGASPFDHLLQAGGFDVAEGMWERLVELRRDTAGLLDAIVEMVGALQADGAQISLPMREEREAAMRQALRGAQREGFTRIVVVCGAGHAPALAALDQEKADAALLRGLPRTEVEVAWIPWTYERMTLRSGYGAGMYAPGWYEHLWQHPGPERESRWMAHVARVLRGAGFDASPASVIEAVHLAEALAELRGQASPGLLELHQAAEGTLCHGVTEPLRLVRTRLEVGERQGSVPASATAVALQRDLELQQKRLRLVPSQGPSTLDLDLRGETDLARSRLLHRLRALDIPWGTWQTPPSGARGTFHEIWRLEWRPDEVVLRVVEANSWGTTVEEAATARLVARGVAAELLPELTDLLSQALFADLADATGALLARVEGACAHTSDVQHLIEALLPLARVARYGDARGTRLDRLAPVIEVLFERALIGLPQACLDIDDDAARSRLESLDHLQESVLLLASQERAERWYGVLRHLSELDDRAHGLVRGRCVRMLLDLHHMSGEDLLRLATRVLSPLAPPQHAAAWIEGVVRGSVTLLLHQDPLWAALDAWLTGLDADTFLRLLPLLRRAFAPFQGEERRALGEKVKSLSSRAVTFEPASAAPAGPFEDGAVVDSRVVLDATRANAVLPVLALILKEKSHGR